jgi:hypothetical protein
MNEPSTELIRAALLHYAEEEFGWGSYAAFINYGNINTFEVPGLGAVKVKDKFDYDSDKNYSGWVENVWVVFDINGKLYKATGTYTSHEGSSWSKELKVVTPKEKVITVYE